ncbi:hypothetical protein JTB14_006639 [Gonioctena quinquepunctata]|nr:hypothetical protein JTB14_006639 [Gonioctena quinquepunctata]
MDTTSRKLTIVVGKIQKLIEHEIEEIYNDVKPWDWKMTPTSPDFHEYKRRFLQMQHMEDDNFEEQIGETYVGLYYKYLRTSLIRKAYKSGRQKDINFMNFVKEKELKYILRTCERVMLWMQDVANGKRTHPRDPDEYTDVYYAICQIWKKEIPEIWETYKVNVAKLGKVYKSNENYMEDEYFNHLPNSETDEEIPEKSQKFRETEEKLGEIKTNKMSMPEVISGIHRLLAEGKAAKENIAKEEKEITKQNLPCLKIKPLPSLYLTVKEPDGKVDKEKAAKNTKFDQGKNSKNPKNDKTIKTDEEHQGKNKVKHVFANIVQTDGPTDLSSDDESIGLADKGDITKIKIIKPKIKRKKISSTPINTPETSEKRDDTPQSPGTKKGKIQTEKEPPPPIILEGKKMLEKTLEIK